MAGAISNITYSRAIAGHFRTFLTNEFIIQHMISRRRFCIAGTAAAFLPVTGALARPVFADSLDALRVRAQAALDSHRGLVKTRDRVGIVDFSRPSSQPRFHVLDLTNGARQTVLVAHGKGSDPDHSGWLERFSNVPGSEATSAGAYVTGADYVGKHGRSRRLIGLDASNSNAEDRAIVIHGAWYVSPAMVRDHGKLGRSQGCLAVAEGNLDDVLTLLPPGTLIYVDKV